jgi:hypothetical protein
MSEILESYLDRVMVYANRPERETTDLRSELRDHLLKKIDDLQEQGLSASDATYRAVNAHGHPRVVGYGLRRGFPLVDIRSSGTARGVIAIGPKAVGVFAFGGVAVGVFACGGFAAGGVALGGVSAALVFAFCGVGIATIAYGGMVAGVLAMGGFAAGVVAMGGFAVGLLAEGGRALSFYDMHTAPAFMKALSSLPHKPGLLAWASGLLIPIVLVLVVVTNILSARERRRIQAADP